jgi:hypothetical protein
MRQFTKRPDFRPFFILFGKDHILTYFILYCMIVNVKAYPKFLRLYRVIRLVE